MRWAAGEPPGDGLVFFRGLGDDVRTGNAEERNERLRPRFAQARLPGDIPRDEPVFETNPISWQRPHRAPVRSWRVAALVLNVPHQPVQRAASVGRWPHPRDERLQVLVE